MQQEQGCEGGPQTLLALVRKSRGLPWTFWLEESGRAQEIVVTLGLV